jgi:hypothetical protein
MTSTDSEVSGMTTHRIEALTDGIFAVAMTLPVLDLKLSAGLGAGGGGRRRDDRGDKGGVRAGEEGLKRINIMNY